MDILSPATLAATSDVVKKLSALAGLCRGTEALPYVCRCLSASAAAALGEMQKDKRLHVVLLERAAARLGGVISLPPTEWCGYAKSPRALICRAADSQRLAADEFEEEARRQTLPWLADLLRRISGDLRRHEKLLVGIGEELARGYAFDKRS